MIYIIVNVEDMFYLGTPVILGIKKLTFAKICYFSWVYEYLNI